MMFTAEPTVFLIASDPKARRMLAGRMKSSGLTVRPCESAEEPLDAPPTDGPACALLHTSEPATALTVLKRLRTQRPGLPVVVVSAGAEVPVAVQAMKMGARDFLEESCPDEAIAQAIEEALQWSAENRKRIGRVESIRRRMERLTQGQREVLDLMAAGKSNREIAAELELTVRAIEARRAKIMQTMRARSLAELVRLTVLGSRP